MTTVDDRTPTKDLEVEAREPAWSTRKSHRCSGARCPWPLFGAWVHLGLTGGLASGRSALYTTCRHVCDLVAIR
jgi:hypothetical protein